MSLFSPPASANVLSPPGSSDRKVSWSSQSRNPVSLRLYKVLGTNFDDEATKSALSTLSAMYASQPSSQGKQVAKDEHNDDDFEESRPPLATVESSGELIPGESATRARKHLRRDMEEKLAEASRKFLQIFGEVNEKLEQLQTHVATMRTSADEAEKQLQLTDEVSKDLLERAGNLREERRDIETKKSILSLFLAKFTLSDEEITTISSRDVPVGPKFFRVMDKAEQIRTDCRVLMAGEEGPSKAGLDIMAETSKYLEQGFDKILRWLTFEFRQLGKEVQLEVTPVMVEAVRRLRKRPEYLGEAFTFLAEARQSTLSSVFIAALTRGGPSGFPRPIELHAHDPMRYIGDMLAWVHQAIAAEQEFLESLFGIKHDGRMVGSTRNFSTLSEEQEWMRELLDQAVNKLCTPLKVRVQQTIRSQESSIVAYKIANLLQFYMVTMSRTIGDDALLSKTLKEITDLAYKAFYDAIENQSNAIRRLTLDLDDSSTPPIGILDHAQILREIMVVYRSSLLGDEDESQQISGFERVLDIMVDPSIEACLHAAEEKRKLRPRWDLPVFVLNCLTYLLGVLEPFPFTSRKQEAVQAIIDERVTTLTDEHYQNLMADGGIDQVAILAWEHKDSGPLSHVPHAQPHELQAALRQFSQWLSSLDVLHSPRLSHLTVPRLESRVHHAALERMAESYDHLCEVVRKPDNKYEAASTLLGSERPFGQVSLLRQIFGIQEKD